MTERAPRRVQNEGSGVEVFAGGGAMGALMRATDWSATSLGPPATWPQSLRSAVSIMLNSRYPIAIYWGDDLALLYNDAWQPIPGSKHPWALARGAREVWPEIWDTIGPLFNRVITTGEGTWSEDELLPMHRHGYTEECYFNFTFSPIRGEGGRVEGIFNAVVETTFRVIGERRTHVLRLLAERTAGARSAAEARTLAADALAADKADVPFCDIYLAGANQDPSSPWPVERVLETQRGELVTVPDGVTLPAGPWPEPVRSAYLAPLVVGARPGQPIGVLVLGISPRRAFDDEYRAFAEHAASHVSSAIANALAYEAESRRAQALVELDRAKTAFFSNVSHEFRTPLTLMISPLEELRAAESHMSGHERQLVEMAHRNSLRLLKLVNSLLDFSRIEAGRADAHFQPTDLATYTAELASAFRSTVERAGLKLEVHAQPLHEPVYVDPDLWEKVVLNLLSNAYKHTFAGEIAVTVREREGHAEVEVRDTGVGIPPGQVGHVFERFHRVPNARARTHEGSGIGLALVQELVKLHGGTISLESTEGQGTTVVVKLPFGNAHIPSDRIGGAPVHGHPKTLAAHISETDGWRNSGELSVADGTPISAAAAEGRSIAGARVIVADDNADMREYVSRLLRERGCEVQMVGDGKAALAAVHASHPDLVLTDVMMPEMDGFELLARLRSDGRTRDIPIILLSARAGEEARAEGVEAGADDYLVKPFSARELLARVESHLLRSLALTGERHAMAAREAELSASSREQERLRELFLQAPAAIAVMRGPQHVYVLTNPAYLRFIGGRNVIGRSIREALPELAGQGIFELLDKVFQTGEAFFHNELAVMLDAKGNGALEETFFNFVYQPIREGGAGTPVTGIFVQAVDVTEQVRARREAESASRAKSEFLAAMSHELRTPLNAIAGYAQLILMELHGPVTPAQREALERVERSQRHLLRLINEVLNLARVEAGHVDYDITDFDVQGLVADMGPMIQPQFDAKDVRYEVRLPGTPVLVRADRDKVTQVLLNLLANALKFTPPGGNVTLDSATRAGVNAAFIRVTDSGIGIPRDKQSAIFEPFVQVHTGPTRVAEGAGLGLAISYDLAKAMGGDLRVRSEPGKGARFTLSLPKGDDRK